MAALVVVIAATALYQIRLNAWNKPFYDSLTHKDFPGFVRQLWVFAELAIALLALNVGQLWLDQTLKLTLRRGLFGALLARWMTPGRADAIARAGLIGENPDQRLQIDVDTLADLTAALGIGLFQSTLLLLSFIGVLWDQSGTVSIPLAGHDFEVPGFMVWCALLYAGTASWLSWRVGRRLVELNAERSSREAAFRFELVRVNEARDAIALQRGETAEAMRIAGAFALGLTERWPGQSERRQIQMGMACKVAVDGEVLGNARRVRRFTREQYFKSSAQMQALFADVPSSLANTVEIARRCSLTLVLGRPQLPNFPIPPVNGEILSVEDYFRHVSTEGLEDRLRQRYPNAAQREQGMCICVGWAASEAVTLELMV